ncbi:MAG: hypothetical protein JWM68_5740, partial [Verrucomicrobiales bacterium]|nr:hypothetical protein [Verrucomicrobiales bacterium]
ATLVVAFPSVFVWVWHPTIEVRLHQNGIARKSFDSVVAIPWSQVLYVRYHTMTQGIHGIPVGTLYYVTIYGTQKQKIKLNNNLNGGTHVIELVLAKILQMQMPRFSALLAQGKEIPFGKISLGQSGIRKGRRIAGWNDIASFKTRRGMVKIKVKNEWMTFYSMRFDLIPNAHAFVQLCREHLPQPPVLAGRDNAVE